MSSVPVIVLRNKAEVAPFNDSIARANHRESGENDLYFTYFVNHPDALSDAVITVKEGENHITLHRTSGDNNSAIFKERERISEEFYYVLFANTDSTDSSGSGDQGESTVELKLRKTFI